MKTYHYFRIQVKQGQRDLQFATTDGDTLDWLFDEIKKVEAGAVPGRHEYQGLGFSHVVRGLSRNDYAVAVYALGLLCQRGWEPFAFDGDFVHLRLASE